jgi:hypothetical protein
MKCEKEKHALRKQGLRCVAVATGLIVTVQIAYAQTNTGGAGIKKANELVRGYFADGATLMYGVGAIVGLIGAVKVYQKWSSGDPETSRVATAWFGACIFLVVVATVLKSFFGV